MDNNNGKDEKASVLASLADGVGTITLNRPEKLNAFNDDLLQELYQALDRYVNNPEVRCIVISAEGRAFCAGQDLSERDPRVIKESKDLENIQKELFHPIIRCITTTEKPVIGAVQGIAAGAGASHDGARHQRPPGTVRRLCCCVSSAHRAHLRPSPTWRRRSTSRRWAHFSTLPLAHRSPRAHTRHRSASPSIGRSLSASPSTR